MTRNGRLIGLLATIAIVVAGSRAALAQDVGHAGAGLALARQICSQCHAVERTQPLSPNPAAPRFETIANVRGMTGTALIAALHTPHPTMPNVMLNAGELSDVVAYFLSLKRAD